MAKKGKKRGNKKGDRDLEIHFHRALLQSPESVLKGIYILDSEYSLYKPSKLLTRDFYSFESMEKKRGQGYFGRVDVIFRYKGNIYCGEIKYQNYKNDDFWLAMKVLGYNTYYQWQIECNGGSINPKPAIMMPVKSIKMEHKIISSRLGIALFGIEKIEENFKMFPMTEMKGSEIYKDFY